MYEPILWCTCSLCPLTIVPDRWVFYLKAGLLTEQHLYYLPTSHWKQWCRGDTSFGCLTAAGTVQDFHRIPFTLRQNKYRWNLVKTQKIGVY